MTQDDNWLRPGLQSLSTAVALADPESWEIRFENAAFFQWFPPAETNPDAPLTQRLKGLDADKARARFANNRAYSFDTDVKVGARSLSLAVDLRLVEQNDTKMILVECRNITKQREAEYMLDSY